MRIDFREPEGHAAGPASVFCDGVDVTERCFYADEEAGEAHCYQSTETVILDGDGNLATEILRGKVEMTLEPAPLTPEMADRLAAIFRATLDQALASGQRFTFAQTQGLDGTVFPGETYRRGKPNNGRTLTLTLTLEPSPLDPGWERESEA